MERMITEKMTFYIESRGLFSPYQSGFRKRQGTMDPVICLETEIRKESIMAVLFDVEKAYNVVWKEGLMIKLDRMGVTRRTFNWIKTFFYLIDLLRLRSEQHYLLDIR